MTCPQTLPILLATLAVAASPLSAQTTSVTLLADKDTTLYEDANGSLANGGGPSIFIGRVGPIGGGTRRRALVRFDVSSVVPAGAKILSVQLEMFSAQSSAFLPINTDAHRVLQDWSEGSVIAPGQGGAGGAAAPGESTWLHRDYPNVFWTNPGGDYDPTPSFSFDMPGIGPILVDPLPGLVADVQDMLDNPGSNFGWLFKTDELQMSTARRLTSSEASSLPPRLIVSYIGAGQAGSFGDGTPTPLGNATLAVAGPVNGGATLPIVYASVTPSSIGANFFSLRLDPIGTPLSANTTALLSPTSPIIFGAAFLTSPNGDGASTFTVPAGFPGFLIVVQAAVIDSSPLGFVLTNAGVMVTQ